MKTFVIFFIVMGTQSIAYANVFDFNWLQKKYSQIHMSCEYADFIEEPTKEDLASLELRSNLANGEFMHQKLPLSATYSLQPSGNVDVITVEEFSFDVVFNEEVIGRFLIGRNVGDDHNWSRAYGGTTTLFRSKKNNLVALTGSWQKRDDGSWASKFDLIHIDCEITFR